MPVSETPDEPEAFIPNRLREARQDAGASTPAELAAPAGVDPSWYGHIEAGRVLPTGTSSGGWPPRSAASTCSSCIPTATPRSSVDRPTHANLERSVSWGATTHVNWCTSCQQTATAAAARRLLADGVVHPVREVQLLTFLEERIRALGTETPWKTEVRRRVLAEGMPHLSPVHQEAQETLGRLLALVPGVEVVGLYDGWSEGSACEWLGRETDVLAAEARRHDERTPDAVRARRAWLAEHVNASGADTVSCQHQYCHLVWWYASDRLAVRHAVSILAEALGCAHPDRYHAAVRLGDPHQLTEQTRTVWQSWGLSEDEALAPAASISNPAFAEPGSGCTCDGPGPCRDHVIPVDVLAGVPPARLD